MDGYVSVPLVDVLKEPMAGAELVSQGLLGEPVVVEETWGSWVRVSLPRQGDYPGWVREGAFVTDEGWESFEEWVVIRATQGTLSSDSGSMPVFMGSALPLLGRVKGRDKVALPGGGEALLSRDCAVPASREGLAKEDPVAVAKEFLCVPYHWGGMTARGIDCSALTWLALGLGGVRIPRDSGPQFEAGRPVETGRRGDLVFFSTVAPGPSHVGIYLGGNRFLHASSKNGVTYGDLLETKWQDAFLGFRRFC